MKKLKYLFLIMLATFMSVTSVNAEELPTVPIEGMGFANSINKNLLKPGWGIAAYYNGFMPLSEMPGYPVLDNFIPVLGNTTYYYSSNFNSFCTFIELNSSLAFVNRFQKWPNFSFTTTSNTRYINFSCSTYVSDISSSNNWFQLEEGNAKTDYIPYEEKTLEPEPDPIIPDATLDSFYSIYTSKLKQFTEYALENKYVLGALGIILLFIVLEIVLNLFRKGGYR